MSSFRSLFLATLLAALVVLTAACDSSPLEEARPEPGAGTEFAFDSEATSDLMGDRIETALEESAGKHGTVGGVVSVMTRNMYVGTDLDAVLSAAPEDVPAAVAVAWELLQQTDYPGRMKAIAKEIASARPHLVGLQEVTLFRVQSPGDAAFGGTTPAEFVQIDFLESLIQELASLGHTYSAVAQVQNIDVEMPLILNPDPSAFESIDVRLTDFDVILARSDVATSNAIGQTYEAYFSVFGGQVDIRRGFVAVDATIGSHSYRFVSTHLEPVETADGYFQELQAAELIAHLNLESKPVILAGDFNSDAASGAVYDLLVTAGYDDLWEGHPGGRRSGFTCCQNPDLMNRRSALDRRIDQIFVRGIGPGQTSAPWTLSFLTGTLPWEKTKSGLWASDHAGVAAWMVVWR